VRALSIGITTRDRPQSLEACLRSIMAILGPGHDVMVFDDASSQRVDPIAHAIMGLDVRVFRVEEPRGTPAGRNRLVREARREYVLLLDDDTRLLAGDAIARAVSVLVNDVGVGAVALAQAERDGRPWPLGMQPASAQRPCMIPAFIGFAHLLKRALFLEMGGYRERLVFYGEEKEFCLRLLARGYLVVYLPDALVAHVPDPGARDPRRYVRQAIRNDCLSSLYNEPLVMAAAALPVRLLRHRRMARGLPGGDPGGLWWIVRDLLRELPAAVRGRRSVGWRVMREWRRLKTAPKYLGPSVDAPTT
jgi:glycosyltransferase involved in cell wall biosynthesis